MNSKRMNRLEELGRVDAEKAKTRMGERNLRDEKSRIVRELKAKGGKVKKKKTFRQEAQKNMALQRVKDRPYNPKDDFETYKKRTQAMGGDVFTAKEMDKKISNKKSAKQSQSRMNLYKSGGSVSEKKIKKAFPKMTAKQRARLQTRLGDRTAPMKKERLKKADGGSLKKVQPHQKGLKKLPIKVRNKMGYMKKGGRVGMGKALRGGGCVR